MTTNDNNLIDPKQHEILIDQIGKAGAERNVLAYVLSDCDAIFDVTAILQPEDFLVSINKSIYTYMIELMNKNIKISDTSIVASMRKYDKVSPEEADSYISTIMKTNIANVDLAFNIELIRRSSVKRQAYSEALGTLADCSDDRYDETVDEFIGHQQNRFLDIGLKSQAADSVVTINDVARKLIADRAANPVEIMGLKSGWEQLDLELSGFQGSRLYIIAARAKCLPGSAKIFDPVIGDFRTIKEIVESKSGNVISMNDQFKLEIKPVVGFYNSGEKEVWKLTTIFGSELLLSKDHPIKTLRGYMKLSELIVGEKIAAADYEYMSVYWDKVLSIECLNYSEEMYDITVADNHNFVYEDVVVSNCGKSSALCNWAQNMVLNESVPILYIDTEMPYQEVVPRIYSKISGVPAKYIENGTFVKSLEYKQKVEQAISYMETKSNYHHCYLPNFTVDQVVSLARKYYIKYGIKALFFDYIKLTSSSDLRVRQDLLLGKLATALKDLAGVLDIPVITACQMNRSGIGTEDMHEGMVRGSDEILFYANYLLMLRNKTEVEIFEQNETGVYNGNQVLELTASRHGGEYEGHLDFQRDICSQIEIVNMAKARVI